MYLAPLRVAVAVLPSAGRVAVAVLLAAAVGSCAAGGRRSREEPWTGVGPATPAERIAYDRPSSSAEVRAFLADLARRSKVARVEPIGRSAGGASMEALILSRDADALAEGTTQTGRLTVLLVGSQHGTEPSGTEALLDLARDVATSRSNGLLDDLDLVIVANANPDGRDARRRVNGNGVNLSTNFVSLSEPEARAIDDALCRWRPDVVLDIHESAVHKSKTLAREGFLTDVEAQLDPAGNPNVDPGLSAFAREQMLPAVLRGIEARGLRAERYQGEITDLSQPITHGGLTARNLRNYAGLLGSLSFLLENRLDPKYGHYDTPRNLKARIAKQRLAVDVFLDEVRAHREEVRSLTRHARDPDGMPPATVSLVARYAPDPTRPEIRVRLRPVDGGPILERPFHYHGRVRADVRIHPPRAYAVTAHRERLGEWLDRHHVSYVVLDQPTRVTADIQRITSARSVEGPHGWGYTEYRSRTRQAVVTLPRGALWVPLGQPLGRLLPLLLDPRSNSSLFQEPAGASLVGVGKDLFVVGVASGVGPVAPRTGSSRTNRVPRGCRASNRTSPP